MVPQVQAAAGDGTLHLTWSDSSSEHDGYHVHYKRSTATDWVDAGHTGLERSMTITGLTNSVSYDARVRLTFDDGTGRWSDVVTATPEENVEDQGQSPTVGGSGDAPPEQEEAAPEGGNMAVSCLQTRTARRPRGAKYPFQLRPIYPPLFRREYEIHLSATADETPDLNGD